MNLKPGRLVLVLLSITAPVCPVPIDRNGGTQEVKENVQEDNTVLFFFPLTFIAHGLCSQNNNNPYSQHDVAGHWSVL